MELKKKRKFKNNRKDTILLGYSIRVRYCYSKVVCPSVCPWRWGIVITLVVVLIK